MQTQSTEPERNLEQETANRRRLARYRRVQRRIESHELTPEQIELKMLPDPWWFKVQAD